MKFRFLILAILFPLFVAGCFRAVVTANRAVNNGFETAYQEFKPSELLAKYTWFKDTYAQLGAKDADIKAMQSKIGNLTADYKGKDITAWAKDDRQTYRQWQQERSTIILSYNDLAAQYNAQMAKFNWRFTNAGDLPKGETEVMPREVAVYKTDF